MGFRPRLSVDWHPIRGKSGRGSARRGGRLRIVPGDTATQSPIRPRRRAGIPVTVVGVLALLAFLSVTLLMLLDGAEVTAQRELRHVALGLPFDWVTQDQALDPPLPYRTGFLSPWENPTTIGWLPLLANLLVVGPLLAVVWRGVRSLLPSRSER